VFFVFQKNILGTVKKDFFINFQQDSEALVVGGIVASELGLNRSNWGLGFIGKDGSFNRTENLLDAYQVFSEKQASPNAIFVPYRSQVGAQGLFYSALKKIFSFNSISKLQYFPSAVLALLMVGFYYLHRPIYGVRYAVIFSVSMVLSPWITSFARNLYWSPFLWFLPLFFATLAYTTAATNARNVAYFFIFISVFAKCVCGYEYITSITLLACSPFVLGPVFKGDLNPEVKRALIVFALCVLGFSSAFLMHAGMRGDTVYEGAIAIYKEDVRRRTYSNPSNFKSPLIKESLDTSPVTVVETYITSWTTPLVTGVPGGAFKVIMVIVAAGMLVKKLSKHKTFYRDVALVSYMSVVPLSWYMLAKGHSYIHTHMNYVLWYFGFVPALFFVLINSIVVFIKTIPQYIKNLDTEHF
jgi:hypothetical protein